MLLPYISPPLRVMLLPYISPPLREGLGEGGNVGNYKVLFPPPLTPPTRGGELFT
jgi:hypothetical protein